MLNFGGNWLGEQLNAQAHSDAALFFNELAPGTTLINTDAPKEELLPTDSGEIQDILEILGRGIEGPTSKEQLIQARLGQGKFKKDVTSTWGLLIINKAQPEPRADGAWVACAQRPSPGAAASRLSQSGG